MKPPVLVPDMVTICTTRLSSTKKVGVLKVEVGKANEEFSIHVLNRRASGNGSRKRALEHTVFFGIIERESLDIAVLPRVETAVEETMGFRTGHGSNP